AFDASRGGVASTITNVAAGALNAGSTDAVNGAQLFATNTQVGSNTSAIANLTTNIATGTADPLAVRYTDATKGTLALGGVNGTVLTNVAAGAVNPTSTDAVNGSQLSATNDAVAGNTANITNLGGSVTTLNSNVAALQTDALLYDGGLQAFNAARGGTPQRITNVAVGVLSATSSDAVNGAQVFGLGNSLAAALGGTSSYDPVTGQVTAGIAYGGATYGNVQGAVSAIETSIGGAVASNLRYFRANSVMADSQAAGTDSTAIGPAAMAGADGSIAAGRNTMAMSAGSVAIGDGSAAMTGKAVAIGFANIASGDGAVSIGDPNIATGDGAVALGRDNQATGIGAVALGDTNFATGDSAVSIGGNNNAVGAGAVAIGDVNTLNGVNAIAIGTGNNVNGAQASAIGNNNRLTGNQSLAFGNNIIATGNDTLAVGNDASASGDSAASFGNRAMAIGLNSTALGTMSVAGADQALAVGENANASGFASSAFGTNAVASATGSVAIGAEANASAVSSVALGRGASTQRGGVVGYTAFGLAAAQSTVGEIAVARSVQVIDPTTGQFFPLGERQITGVGAGSANTDAVNVAQLRGVSDTLGAAFATSLGGGAAYTAATGTLTGPTYVINGATYATVGDALAGVSGQATQVANTSVTYDTATRDRVTLGGAAGTTVTNVAAGTLSAASTDAVNGGQLFATNQQVTNNTTEITTIRNTLVGSAVSPVQYSNAATPTAPNGGVLTNDVTLIGADVAAPVRLHNVAAGSIAVGSTDAVNGGQVAAIAAASQNAIQYDRNADGSRANVATLVGGTAGAAVRITNVANGVLGATSTDAVNGAQLNAVGQQVASNTTNITNLQSGTAGFFQVNNTAGNPTPVASGVNAIAAGGGATSSGANAVALGTAANATAANSVALGTGSIADRADSVSVGTAAANRQITNVAAGISPSDAVNVGQLSSGLNQTLAQANTYTDTRLNQLGFDLKEVRRDANGGTAAAMALATIPQAYGPGMGMVGGGISNWGGEAGFAVGVSKANADGSFIVKAGATMNTRGKGGGAVGAGFAF
ncbi:YadA-like family protein, partial [Sphingomonas sp. PB2P12]|uniref:YadA-like family protein n=1 Tax=Sphingomonas sandaracina TaxID=3096157 RepID=UPI002FCB458E